jgi:hypothetical protein
MMTKVQRNLKAIKRMNKGEKLRQLPLHHPKFLEDGLMRNGVKSFYNVKNK